MIEVSKIPKIIDHTNLEKEASEEDIKKTCQEAKEFGFRGVCVFPKWARLVSEELRGTGIKVVILIDPPIGDSPTEEKVKESLRAKEDGASEIDVVMNIPLFKHEKHPLPDSTLEDIIGTIFGDDIEISREYLSNNFEIKFVESRLIDYRKDEKKIYIETKEICTPEKVKIKIGADYVLLTDTAYDIQNIYKISLKNGIKGEDIKNVDVRKYGVTVISLF